MYEQSMGRTVCGISWGTADSKVACKQLGHQELGICMCLLVYMIHT